MTTRRLATALLLVTTLVSGCNKEATGQVAAIVNGEEITLQEINNELGQMQIPASTDKKVAQQVALNRIVERRLLAQSAKEEGVDRTPEYLLKERQLQDALLIQLYAKRLGAAAKAPTPAEVDKYIADHPEAFTGRKLLQVDQIMFPIPADPNELKQLEDDHSMDQVAATLKSIGIEFRRGPSQIDSAALGQDVLDKIEALPPGEPFILPRASGIVVAVVTGEVAAPRDSDELRPAVAERMQQESLQALMQERLKTVKAGAKIQYQTGFAPPDDAAKPATPATGAATTQ